MRTTVTLDEDVARLVEGIAHREHRSTQEVINDGLRRALGRHALPYQVVVHHSALRSGIDESGLNHLAD